MPSPEEAYTQSRTEPAFPDAPGMMRNDCVCDGATATAAASQQRSLAVRTAIAATLPAVRHEGAAQNNAAIMYQQQPPHASSPQLCAAAVT
jgi:hypothetical protein